MSEEEKNVWNKVKKDLELQLWELIDKEHELMEQIVMINSLLEEDNDK